MTTVHRSALIERPAKQLYDLVLDVESYPEFLPWCGSAVVAEQNDEVQVASVSIDVRR